MTISGDLLVKGYVDWCMELRNVMSEDPTSVVSPLGHIFQGTRIAAEL